MRELDQEHDVAYRALTGHRHYPYRACAPNPDPVFRGEALWIAPGGGRGLPVDAWCGPEAGTDETRGVREAREKAAATACADCPVLAECRTYALTETPDGQLAEPEGVWGGMPPLARHRDLVRRRVAAGPVAGVPLPAKARTRQKLAVLHALAAHTAPQAVAAAAGMDVRTANWHRSGLATWLRLDKATATRGQLLDAAREAGLLRAGTRVVPCDGSVLAVPARCERPAEARPHHPVPNSTPTARTPASGAHAPADSAPASPAAGDRPDPSHTPEEAGKTTAAPRPAPVAAPRGRTNSAPPRPRPIPVRRRHWHVPGQLELPLRPRLRLLTTPTAPATRPTGAARILEPAS